ncbi:MAG: phosphomethylpyrimidine synthase ThiC [Dehalococcoidia bacterium]|nr:phosphomethylpyrimidine synthase ThiC [Dehalococcoidia bacterium]
MTQIEQAKKGIISPEMKKVALAEQLDADRLCQDIASGSAVIPTNVNHPVSGVCGIGKGLKIKVNANIGTSSDVGTMAGELEKLRVSIKSGADTVMDLSTGGDIRAVRRTILKQSSVPIGTVPIYQAMIEAGEKYGPIVKATADDIFNAIEEQAAEGVDFVTVHCGVTQSAIQSLKSQRRITDVVSRGGAFLLGWMIYHEKENPLYENYDRLLDIAFRYDVTLSLGDGMRPGSLADASDRPQIQELVTLGELVERAWKAGVQVMVEGPGHLPLNHIGMNMQLQKSLCKGAPFYVLGPLVTDVGAGYDHITGAIGGAIAGAYGADFLCYVTPAEHLSLPDAEDVRNGVIASRIAAHAADIVRSQGKAAGWDRQMSIARKHLDWDAQAELSIDPDKAKEIRSKYSVKGRACSMCGEYCAMDLVEKYLGVTANKC